MNRQSLRNPYPFHNAAPAGHNHVQPRAPIPPRSPIDWSALIRAAAVLAVIAVVLHHAL